MEELVREKVRLEERLAKVRQLRVEDTEAIGYYQSRNQELASKIDQAMAMQIDIEREKQSKSRLANKNRVGEMEKLDEEDTRVDELPWGCGEFDFQPNQGDILLQEKKPHSENESNRKLNQYVRALKTSYFQVAVRGIR